MENSTTPSYKFNIIKEVPSKEDIFEEKTHEEAANVLLNLLESETGKGITVGLEGSWGSGKSTVINILRKKIDDLPNNESLFFSFDAWAHEGDPLRISFLEKFIHSLDPNGEDNFLREQSKEITNKKKTVETEVSKKTSKLGGLLSLSGLFIPIATLLSLANGREKVFMPWQDQAVEPNYLIILSFFLASLPFWVLLYWSIFGENDKHGKRKWEIFESESTETSSQNITEDSERTSVEFESYFVKILQHLLSDKFHNGKYKKIVIIVDNLDRVEPEHAKLIWSTLQTFFQHREIEHSNISNALWFIIPFDREGLSKSWNNNTSINNNSNTKINVAKSFLDKSLQVIVEVPKPVMSSWVNYAGNAINTSLIGWPDDKRATVLDTYQKYASSLNVSPTPREINSFVNQVGVLGLRWGNIFSAESISLYAAYKLDINESTFREKLLENELSLDTSNSNIENLKSELSGLLFGVSKQKGMQLLLEPEIKQSCTNGDGKTLKKLIDSHGYGFWVVWYSKKTEFLPTKNNNNDHQYFISLIKALHQGMISFQTKIHHDVIELAKNYFEKLASFDWTNKNEFKETIPNLIELTGNDKKTIKTLANTVEEKLLELFDAVAKKEYDPKELENIYVLKNILSEFNQSLSTKKFSAETISTAGWIQWLQATYDQNLKFESILPDTSLITALIGQAAFNQASPQPQLVVALDKTLDIHPKAEDWIKSIPKILGWSHIAGRTPNQTAYYDLVLNLYSKVNTTAQTEIEKFISDPQFWTVAASENPNQMISLPILAAIAFGNEVSTKGFIGTNTLNFWKNPPPKDVCQQIFDELKKHSLLAILWELSTNSSNATAIEILKNYSDNTIYECRGGVKWLEEYNWVSEQEMPALINNLCVHGGFKETMPDLVPASTYHEVYYLLNKYGDSEARAFVATQIDNLTPEEWNKAFMESSFLLDCMEDTNNYKFSGAFQDYFQKVSTDKEVEPDSRIWNQFNRLLELTQDKDFVMKTITESYFSTSKDSLSDLGFQVMHAHLIVDSVADENLMHRLNNWLDDNQKLRIQWFIDNVHSKFKKPLDSLKSRIQEKLDNNDEDELNIYQELNKKLNLKLKRKPENDNNVKKDEP